ncbi:sensor histidine kinase [Thiocystis violacea]|uniref:sensor histidine kinase n=1 Tax=Thiocystis violacea TaxID=13725 RepID=UPI001904DB42|nr:HAMP domain-containing sensor histidine kinase [Thiocystis violacea]MBK1723810.1 histidine kinase [Thiocystis violacea]
MTRRSLRVRLILAAAGSVSVALLVAGLSLMTLFERHVERRIGAELLAQVNQLAAATNLGAEGRLQLDPSPTDPRFGDPLSGHYWQIDDETGASPDIGVLRSRSLWDTRILLPPDRLEPGAVHTHVLPGPDGQILLVRERLVLFKDGARAVRLMAAMDRRELTDARDAFVADMLPYLGVVALVLTLASLVQIQTGLAPLERVRRGVAKIRSGAVKRLDENVPDEVLPLVMEMNALLAAREEAVERARAWTADLAHGLKTPLSALAADAARLRTQGNPVVAADLEQLAETMRRRVDRELVRVRVRSGRAAAPVGVEVAAAIGRIVRTLRRIPGAERLQWKVVSPDQVRVGLMPDDLLELLGNLLENAGKWAHSRVEIAVEVKAGEQVEIRISDDGPGVPAEYRDRLGERGVRLDERKDGSGLGLAIVRDVVDAYGGSLGFDAAVDGGLIVWVRLPAASPADPASRSA